ncbi:serine/arginine repetitive matrix protein 4 isoform X2 [Gouania willdenowi]|uniref:serine/arginine repetitive matrix protein 4 isoform X2 n=1 Tax=Gouania willdenowi TaxID=441366 RepID=UPI001054A453|nr:serine/arginine repetitive matrix protein 4 isoform X2 [Gouania willdenowi]
MQSLCSIRLGPPCGPTCGPSPPSLGPQDSSASFQLEEKQLFEKFWKGTFKAVATPRLESVIMASITASRRVTGSETTSCQPLKPDQAKVVDLQVDSVDRNGCSKERKYHSHRRAKRLCDDEDLSPRPKGRKKKRKAERKRKRKRSPSYSLSPPRKKKKKKKKNSKKSRRHRYTSKKSKHRSSTLKRKRKDDRKHKKSSRNHSHRRRRIRRHHLQKSMVRQTLGHLAAGVEPTNTVLNHADIKWRPTTKSVCKTAPKSRSVLSTGTVVSSKPGGQTLHRNGLPNVVSQAEGQHDYDSGNDTSSPPSSKTGISRAGVTDGKKNHTQLLSSPEKQKLADRDIASDSGNSVTSYTSLCKPSYEDDGLSATIFSRNGKREQITLGCRLEVKRCPKTSSCSKRKRDLSRRRRKSRPSSSRSRSRSSGSSRYSGRYSRSLSLSSYSTYSRSPSSSVDLRRRDSTGSLSSRGSYYRHNNDRQRNRKSAASSREKDLKHKHKVSKKRRGRKSYSPMRKRRRDSPSHLEARRITSARKRPIPYFRPSPSTSIRSSSVSSWSSLFTRDRSRSPIYSVSRSRSRSLSYSSYRSYSRSSSWDSRDRSRSRSRSSLKRRKKTRH